MRFVVKVFYRFAIGVMLAAAIGVAAAGQRGLAAERDQKEKVRIVVTEKKDSQASDGSSQAHKARQENRNKKQ